MQRHRRSRFQISKFKESTAHMSIIVEKSEKFVAELREFGRARKTLIIFHIIVQEMDGLGFKQCSYFWIFMKNVPKMDFIDVRINSLISNSGPEKHPRKDSEGFKSCSQVPELVEEEGGQGQDEDLEVILKTIATIVDGLQGREGSIKDILEVSVEGQLCDRGVFWLKYSCWFKTIPEIGVVGWLPLVLPTYVVGVASGPVDLIVLYRPQQPCHAATPS